MGLIIENFKMAMSSVKANKMRSFLTMLGIIIGITSVIAITSIGEGTTTAIDKAFQGFGKNRIILYMNFRSNEELDESKYFSFEDIDVLSEKFEKRLSYIAPFFSNNVKVKNVGKEENAIINLVDYNFFTDLTLHKMVYGRNFKKDEIEKRKNFALIDIELAQKLFGKEDVLGEKVSVTINDEVKTLSVIGVFKKEKTLFDSLAGDDRIIFAPYTLGQDSYIGILDIQVKEGLNSKTEGDRILKYLTRYKRVKKDAYKTNTLDEQVKQANSFFGVISLGLGIVAAISLLVGGIGIMNIMLVSVTERTREIGIRKSLGARKKDILMQFLIESIMLSGVGGLIGTMIGVLISNAITGVMGVDSGVPISSVLIAVGFSAFVGIFFGIFPAYKASSLDPIDALRYE